jgi:hypothetical protein
LHEKAHGQKISRAPGAEPALDECLMHGTRAFAPVGSAHAAAIKEGSGSALSEVKTGGPPSVQQVGILNGGDQGKAGMHPNCLRVRWGHDGRLLESR